jgi:hypothetical protein
MTFVFEETNVTRKWVWVAAAVILLIAFMAVPTTRADGLDIEMIVVRAEQQQVDVDGDGRLETFSADYTVYEDGTADGVVYIDNEPVDIESGAFGLTAEGYVFVDAQGSSRHEVLHALGFYHMHSAAASGGCCTDDIIWDIDTAGVTQSVIIDSLVYYLD